MGDFGFSWGGPLDSGGAFNDAPVSRFRGAPRRKRGPEIDQLRLLARRDVRREIRKDLRGPPAGTDRALARDLVRFGGRFPAGHPLPVPPGAFRLPPSDRFWLPLASHTF